ncbi:MAG: bifunctional precorrin-2 dehydrogenase/sirohydrochlorin ferrochelatase [Methanobacteriaceae archaeon]|jgi:precorrin-2 dehydrogenase/sirohydrochlorin ferrochelatase|nr:bifunctional precorrin-2 dehydrogenase/sirohydrochlorin ferrochelatase [Methanobacteriaceae archaeon]
MDWTSLYFKTNDLNVLILGTGEVATRRANRFLDKNSNVILVGNSLNDELIEKRAILKDQSEIDDLVKWSDLIIIATGDIDLADYVTNIGRDKLVNRADNPNLANLIVPTTFKIEDVEISIFTGGKSPLMAHELRKKIQNIITSEDILEIKIQDYGRKLLKNKVLNQKDRRDYLYSFLKDEILNNYIKNNDLKGAKLYLKNLINDI